MKDIVGKNFPFSSLDIAVLSIFASSANLSCVHQLLLQLLRLA